MGFFRRASAPASGDSNVAADKIVAPGIASFPELEADTKPRPKAGDLDKELFLPIARELGKDNDSIGALLINAEQKIDEIESIKREIGKLVEPVTDKLRSLEQTKSELADSRGRIAVLEGQCARLEQDLAAARQQAATLEAFKAEQAAELMARQTQVADLQGRVLRQTEENSAAREESQHLKDDLAAAGKRAVALEAEAEAVRQKLAASDDDRAALRTSLGKVLAEKDQMAARLLDAEKALASAQTRAQAAEQQLGDTRNERQRLAAALEEAKQKHQGEVAAHKASYDALLARTASTEKLLEDMRKSMLERAEEIRTLDRRLAETLQPLAAGPRPAEAPRPAEPARAPAVRAVEPPQPAARFHETPLPEAYPAPRKRRYWRTDFFDWMAGRD